jgi:cystathionine gamma-synthase
MDRHCANARAIADALRQHPAVAEVRWPGLESHPGHELAARQMRVVGGFVATNDDAVAERLAFLQNAVGAVPGPLDCYLVLRGVKTLAVRMDRHCANARVIAHALRQHPAVADVRWPGLDTHPGHELAARQMRDFGGMVSFTLHGGEDAALKVAGATRLFTLAESLGAVESLIEHPGRMTHASVAGAPGEVDPALVRLSVGLEHADDLVADLIGALDTVASG